MKNQKIAIIGCGNLGKSILNGLLKNKEINPSNITATKRNIQTFESYSNRKFHCTDNNVEAVKKSEIIILAIKPYNLISIVKERPSVATDFGNKLVFVMPGRVFISKK